VVEANSGGAEAAGDVDEVTGASAGAEQTFSMRDRASQNHVGDSESGLGKVAAGERNLISLREREKAVEESVDPGALPGRRDLRIPRGAPRFWLLDEGAGQGQRQKRSHGTCAHGGQVAESASEGAVADGLCRVRVEAEVAAGDRKIGGDGEFFAGAGTKDGAVVANSETQLGSLGLGGAEANLVEEAQLAHP
jgi:hypothetical protein